MSPVAPRGILIYWRHDRHIPATLVNGYVEESILPRLYREAPLNSIWEGSGNVQCLDIIHAVTKRPEALDAFFAELESARGANRAFDGYITAIKREVNNKENVEYNACYLAERMAKAMQAAQLIKTGNGLISDDFCASRLQPCRGLNFGALPGDIDCKKIIERARPEIN